MPRRPARERRGWPDARTLAVHLARRASADPLGAVTGLIEVAHTLGGIHVLRSLERASSKGLVQHNRYGTEMADPTWLLPDSGQ
jgi:hypothetical protein